MPLTQQQNYEGIFNERTRGFYYRTIACARCGDNWRDSIFMDAKIEPPEIFQHKAIAAAIKSPCQKSKRGVAIWNGNVLLSVGWNHQPEGFECDGSERCRASCNKLCEHAEMDALLKIGNLSEGAEMLHIEVKDGKAVSSGPPSCWQCSRSIVDRKIHRMWLLENGEWKAYTAKEFHEITLEKCGIWIY